mgnify:CR=1 FL=1
MKPFIQKSWHVFTSVLVALVVLIAVALVVFSTVAPFLLYTTGLAKVESGKASIMASLEPVVASILGVAAFGEPLSAATVIGILCVLSGVYILR